MLSHMAETLHQGQLQAILVIQLTIAPGTNKLGMSTHKEFEQLVPVSVLALIGTAGWPQCTAVLVASLCQVLVPKSKWRSKILLVRSFYGVDYSVSMDEGARHWGQ